MDIKEHKQRNIEQIPKKLRPRERLLEYGPKILADHELLAVLLRTGTKNKNVVDLALEVLNSIDSMYDLRYITLQQLIKIPGIGDIKATEILAAIEFGSRVAKSNQLKEGTVLSSTWVGEFLLKELSNLTQEHVMALYLNTKNEIIKKEIVFKGSLNSSVAHPREIFKGAVQYSAARIILAHNHPSGDTEPSDADLLFTKRMVEAGEMMGIEIIDHFIIGSEKYLSLQEHGLM